MLLSFRTESVTAKQLHQQTKTILDQLERGKQVVITRNGRTIARLEPISNASPAAWDTIMTEVWKAQDEIKPSERVPNPVLVERQHRRR